MGFGNVVSCFNVTLGQRCILDFRTVMHLRIYIVGACYPVVQACSSLCYSWLLSKWTEFCSCIASFFSFVLTVSHVIDYTGLVTNWNSIWIFSSTYDFRVYRSLNHLGLTGKDQRMRRFFIFLLDTAWNVKQPVYNKLLDVTIELQNSNFEALEWGQQCDQGERISYCRNSGIIIFVIKLLFGSSWVLCTMS
jgi:hypothetical protein